MLLFFLFWSLSYRTLRQTRPTRPLSQALTPPTQTCRHRESVGQQRIRLADIPSCVSRCCRGCSEALLVKQSPVTSQRQLFPLAFERNSAHVHVRKRLSPRGGRCQHGRIQPERNCFHVAPSDAQLDNFSLLIGSAVLDGSNDTATLTLSPSMSLLF